ncbi:two-component system sensor histidine kinase AtoS [Schinkia sp. CFF1]
MIKVVKGNFRLKMIIMTIIFVTIPILISGYFTKLIAEENLLKEKEKKLYGITYILDQYLQQDFNAILKEKGALHANKQIKIEILNRALSNYTDSLAKAYPGIGVGYYVKDLQAIVTYGPSSEHSDKVGEPINPTHPGNLVLKTGKDEIVVGKQVRGQIMNAMHPIIRKGEIIGYAWANELTIDVDNQLAKMDRIIYICLGLGMLLIIVLLLRFWDKVLIDIEHIKQGLQKMKYNLKERIVGIHGEIGEIADEVNRMAEGILNARSFSENIMDSMVDSVITVDINGNITFMNKAVVNLLEVNLDEVIDKPYMKSMFNDGAFRSFLMKTLETGENYIGVEMEYPANGKQLYISSSSSRLFDSTGNFIGAVVTFKDITEKKRLEQQVYRADRLSALGVMMAGVAHEIRNPLTAIKSLIQYLQEGSTEEERKEFYPMIIKEVNRANKIIEELLYFARPSDANILPTDVNQLIKESVDLTKSVGKNKVKYHLNFEENLPNIEIDPEQFKQVFLNILFNSIQAMEKSGEITIESLLDVEQGKIVLHFSDTGCGIKEENLDKVFDPFYTSKKDGTGLGLAVVQRIITSHKGDVWLQNIQSGGVVVTIQIPIHFFKGEVMM